MMAINESCSDAIQNFSAHLGGIDAESVKGLFVHRSTLACVVRDEQDVLA
jgi:hypothetical protein